MDKSIRNIDAEEAVGVYVKESKVFKKAKLFRWTAGYVGVA